MSFTWTPLVDGPPGIGTPVVSTPLNALAAKVGDDGAAVVTSLDYLLKNAASIEPGHKHFNMWSPDGSALIVTVVDFGGENNALMINNPDSSVAYQILFINAQAQATGSVGTELDFTYYDHLGTQLGLFCFGAELVDVTDLSTRVFYIFDLVSFVYPWGINSLGDTWIGGNIDFSTMTGAALVAKASGKIGIGTPNPVISGTGLLHMAADTFRLDTARTPATAGAAGNPGEFCWDSGFLYICTALNTWKKAAISSW